MKGFDTLTERELELAGEPPSASEQEAYRSAQEIKARTQRLWYRAAHRLEWKAAQLALAHLLRDRGQRLRDFASRSNTRLSSGKILHLMWLVSKLRPLNVYELGAGGTTVVFAELLRRCT